MSEHGREVDRDASSPPDERASPAPRDAPEHGASTWEAEDDPRSSPPPREPSTLDAAEPHFLDNLAPNTPLFKALRGSEISSMSTTRGPRGVRFISLLAMAVTILVATSGTIMILRMWGQRQPVKSYPFLNTTGSRAADAAFWREVLAGMEEVKREQQRLTGHADSAPVLIVGDLHGDLDQGIEALKLVGAVDDAGRWIGGSSTLVQMGDIVDRGDHSLDLIDLFEKLKVQASVVGGKVITLLGNHELMLIQGDYRYVSPREVSRLEHVMMKAVGGESTSAKRLANVGLNEWRDLMKPDGQYGSLLRKRPVAYVHKTSGCSTLFVHAGMCPTFLDQVKAIQALSRKDHSMPDEIGHAPLPHLYTSFWNIAVRHMLAQCKNYACSDSRLISRYASQVAEGLVGGEGAVWTRLYTSKPILGCQHVDAVTKKMGVERIVVGHTIQSSGEIIPKCGGKLLMVDVGISTAILGNMAVARCEPAAVSTSECTYSALYKTSKQPLC